MAIYRLDLGSDNSQRGGSNWTDPMSSFSSQNLRQQGYGSEKRYSGKIAGYADPYGLKTATTRGVAGSNVADAEDYAQYLEDVRAGVTPSEGVAPYLGFGEQTDVVMRSQVDRSPAETPDEWRRRNRFPEHPGNQQIDVYGRPLYRRGAEYTFGTKMDADGVRNWQAFFSGLGFKTGPAGMWGAFESDAMRAFMTMANTSPGGGMTVQNLRESVMRQVQQGIFFFRGISEEGDLLPQLLGEDVVDDLDGGGGGGGAPEPTGPGFTEPYTQTTTERQVQRYSREEGKMALRNLVSQSIGRAPTDDEVKQYVRQLNAAFNEDPTVITTVTTTDPVTGESETDRTVDESDVSAEGRATDFAREGVPEEELREYQTGRYMDTLMSAIGM